MTYTLNALNGSSGKSSTRTGLARFGHEVSLIVGLLALVFLLLSLLSYSPQDPAWSTSGALEGRWVNNWVGRSGAWLADTCYFGFGFSIWWLVLAFVTNWLGSLLRWTRGGVPPADPLWLRRMRFWGGLALLLMASTSLEWSRMYRFESLLPGHAGGVVGYVFGLNAMQWLGFTGSGLAGIVLLVLGAALVFGFSWGQLAERLGKRIYSMI